MINNEYNINNAHIKLYNKYQCKTKDQRIKI